jgi:DNA-binding transcriptional ArsR family regulator
MRAMKVFNDPKAFELAADPTRRRIIYLLRAKELSACQIAEELGMTPQAIYHHTRKMLNAGLIEVAKEERIDHFIETYYRAAAEIFSFTYGEASDQRVKEAQMRDALGILTTIGLITPMDEETISKFADLSGKLESISMCYAPMFAEKISQLEDLDFFTKQTAVEVASNIVMSDEQFDELQSLQRESRKLLKPKLANQMQTTTK